MERILFAGRKSILLVLLLLTMVMAWFAVQLRVSAGFEKQMPTGHEYIQAFQEYRSDMLGANRLNIVVRARLRPDGTGLF